MSTSLVLFKIYAVRMMKEALHSREKGVKVGGALIKTVRFADDQAMVAEQSIMEKTNSV